MAFTSLFNFHFLSKKDSVRIYGHSIVFFMKKLIVSDLSFCSQSLPNSLFERDSRSIIFSMYYTTPILLKTSPFSVSDLFTYYSISLTTWSLETSYLAISSPHSLELGVLSWGLKVSRALDTSSIWSNSKLISLGSEPLEMQIYPQVHWLPILSWINLI